MMATLLGVWMQRTKFFHLESFELVIKLNFSPKINPSAKEMVERKIHQNRGRYQAVIQPLVHHYKDLTSNQVAVGSVDVAGNTITIYGNIMKLGSNNAALERTKSISSDGKSPSTNPPEEKSDKICRAVLLQGFKLEKELKGYMQSGNPKVTLKGSYFKILNDMADETSPNVDNQADFDNVQSISGDRGATPSINSVEMIETRGP